MNGTVLVTGAAGFIGHHTCRRLLAEGHTVVGVDSMDDYYDPALKRARLRQLLDEDRFTFGELDLSETPSVVGLFHEIEPTTVIHLAARPGVRASIDRPHSCVRNNITAYINVIEAARQHHVEHFVYASSSSVYGASRRWPYSEHDPAEHPISLYAATKRSNELMAHAYAHIHGMAVTGLRFFTVYGPWGRPDMAYYRFAEAIRLGKPIRIFGDGTAIRDFTFVDDIVTGITAVASAPAKPSESWDGHVLDPATSAAPFRVYNIGHGQPIDVNRLVTLLEESLGRTTSIIHEPPRAGDVEATESDTSDLAPLLPSTATTPPEVGIDRFASWYADYHSMARL